MSAGRLRLIVIIAVFDIGGPLVAYNLLRSAGFSSVTALVLSGVFPAAGVIIGVITRRRIDALGVLVLAGIVVGAVLGLVSHNAKLVLDEGSVGTAVFGLICLGSLTRQKPLMYRLALEFIGPDTGRGRDFASLWQYAGFRRAFRVTTAVWGAGYLAEAAARVVIVQNTSAGTALAISKVRRTRWPACSPPGRPSTAVTRSARERPWPPRRRPLRPSPPPRRLICGRRTGRRPSPGRPSARPVDGRRRS